MACSNCGYSGAYSSHGCPNCNAGGRASYSVEQAQSDRNAGYEFGYAVVSGIFWLLDNRYLSYVWFWLIWVIASAVIGQQSGFISEDWLDRPFAFDVVGVLLPIAIAIAFREQIPRIMKWVWLGLIVSLAGLAILKLVGDGEPAEHANPVTLSAEDSSAARAAAVREALDETADSEITFIAPGSDDAPRVIFEGVDLRLCEIDDPGTAACQRYCATLEVDDRPRWCN